MTQEIAFLNLKRNELVKQYNDICKKIYDDDFRDNINVLNKKINELQKIEMEELRKRYGED